MLINSFQLRSSETRTPGNCIGNIMKPNTNIRRGKIIMIYHLLILIFSMTLFFNFSSLRLRP